MSKKAERYSDIIDLPHHQSVRRPHMSNYNRAAQFAPFSALVGYEDLVQDTSGMLLNDKKKLLSEDAKQTLDFKLEILQNHLLEQPIIEIIYYDGNAGTKGGMYCAITGTLKKIEDCPPRLILEQGKQVNCDDVLDIYGQIFEEYLKI